MSVAKLSCVKNISHHGAPQAYMTVSTIEISEKNRARSFTPQDLILLAYEPAIKPVK